MKKYDITSRFDTLDTVKSEWLSKHLSSDQYKIIDDGWLISNYTLMFSDPVAETLYLLRWG